ncbi:MAG: IS110 family transposase [Candidatus Hydrothermarchaeales archaeon]
MEFIGLDYHKQYTVATRIGPDGQKEQSWLSNTPQEFARYFDSEEETSVVFESSRGWALLYEMIRDKVNHIKMAHPLKVKAIASARIKNDKIDSNILAELLKADLIPEAHLRNEENRTRLKVLRQRAFFVKLRTMVRNRIHDLLDEQPFEIRQNKPDVSSLWGKKGMNWLKTIRLPLAWHQELLEALLELMSDLNQQVARSDGMVKKLYAEDSEAQLIDTLPGFSAFGSLLVSNEIDGVDRFGSAKQLVSYAGLVPSTYSSGGRTFHGSLTKQGSKWLRWICIQAVSPAVRSNAQISAYYERIKRRKGTKAARVATARRLLTIAYHCLKEKRSFVPLKMSQGQHKIFGNDRAALTSS